MSNPIPDFDHNLVLPPHKGDPTIPSDISPYQCTTEELCQKLATTPARKDILTGFLNFREQLRTYGLVRGYQWLDGSFLEEIETLESRAPRDIDVVTVFFGYDIPFQKKLEANFQEFTNITLAKTNYFVDHYPFDATHDPQLTILLTRYWTQLFSHSRRSVWKGMLEIQLNTPSEDSNALTYLNGLTI